MTNYFQQREEEEKAIPAFRGFRPAPEEKTLGRNPLKLRWAKLIVGDIVTYQDGYHNKLTASSFLVLSNKKQKISFLKIAENVKRDKAYLDLEYLYCESILREGQVCNSLLDLQRIEVGL